METKLHFTRCKECGAIDAGQQVNLCAVCKTTELHFDVPSLQLDVAAYGRGDRGDEPIMVFGTILDQRHGYRAQLSVCMRCARNLGLVEESPPPSRKVVFADLSVEELQADRDAIVKPPTSTEGGGVEGRELTGVLEAVIKVIPGDQIQLIGPLAEIRDSAFYCPPEGQTVLWRRATMVLAEQFGERDLDGWELQVAGLFSGRKPPPSPEGGE